MSIGAAFEKALAAGEELPGVKKEIERLRDGVAELRAVQAQASPQLLSWKQAASMLGISVSTLRRWVQDGKLEEPEEYSGLKRFRRGNLERYLGGRDE